MAEDAPPRSPRAAAAWLAGLLFATYAYFMPAPAANENSRFALVRSLVERGRIDIDPFAVTTSDVAHARGHAYSDKAPGTALLAVPAYGVYRAAARIVGAAPPAFKRESELRGRPVAEDRLFFSPGFRRAIWVCNLATNALAGALLGALFFLQLLRAGLAARAALAATAALSLGSLVFAYSTVFFGHVLAATALFGAFFVLERTTHTRGWLLAGLAAGLAVLIELPAALGAAVLAGHLVTSPALVGRGKLRALAWFALGTLAPLLALGAYHTAAFGGPFATGYAHVAHPTFAAGMAQGILGVRWPRPGVLVALFLGSSRGLLWLAPVLAVALVGLARGLRAVTTRRPALTATTMVAAFALMNAGYYMWWGGAAIGPRHLVPALPFLALGFAWAWPARPALRLVVGTLLAISVGQQLGAVAVSPLAPPDVNLLFGYLYPNLLRNQIAIFPGASNLGMALGLRGLASLAPLLVLWAAGAVILWREIPPGEAARGET